MYACWMLNSYTVCFANMTHMTESGMPQRMKSPRRQPVTLEYPGEDGEKGNVDARPRSAKGAPRIGRLEELSDWKRQIGKIYRAVRRGEMATEIGTRLVYMLEAGARIAREESREKHEKEQREQVARLEEQLTALQAARTQPALPPPTERELPDWAKDE